MLVQLVDTPDAVKDMVREISGLPNDPPSLYFDCEGINLGRHGTLDILQLYALPLDKTFVVDVFVLKHSAFITTANTDLGPTTLKKVLQSERVMKGFFDVRNDADALLAHYGVALDGVIDIQMMEYWLPRRQGPHLRGLKLCVEQHAGLSKKVFADWKVTKENGIKDMKGNEVPRKTWSQARPMNEKLLTYVCGDVQHLHKLYKRYRQLLGKKTWKKAKASSKERLIEAMSAEYDPQGPDKGKGPARDEHGKGKKHCGPKLAVGEEIDDIDYDDEDGDDDGAYFDELYLDDVLHLGDELSIPGHFAMLDRLHHQSFGGDFY